MKISSINAYSPISSKGNKKITKQVATALAALAIANPITSKPAHAQDCYSQPYYGMIVPSDISLSDFERAYATYGDNFELNILYDANLGFYYLYGNKAYDLQGNELDASDIKTYVAPKKTQTIKDTPKFECDYDRLYAIFGDSSKLEVKYDNKLGRYYTYAGIALDLQGNIIQGYESKKAQSYWSPYWYDSSVTDFMKMYAIYNENFAIEEHYDRNFGTYYKYAGRFYAPDGSEIINSQALHDDIKPSACPGFNKTTSRVTDLMRRIQMFKGSGYEVEEHYDKNYGRYYTFAGKIYDIYGNEIGDLKNFQKNQSASKNNTSNYYYNYIPSTTQNVDSRAPKGSDFYYAILTYGDKYKIEAHYDPGRGGIGSYYQYGPMAFDKNGNQIANPENLYGFKTK